MKTVYVTLLVAVFVVLATSVNAQEDCPKFCTYEYRPVCGFNGSCYSSYGNGCALRSDKCMKNKDLKEVDMARCDEARAKSNPEVVLCPEP